MSIPEMKNKSEQPSNSDSRRDFLKKGALAAGAVMAGVKTTSAASKVFGVPAKGSVLGANDRLNVGFIGVGGQGFTHVRVVTNTDNDLNTIHNYDYNAVGVAGCDLYSGRRDRVQERLDGRRRFGQKRRHYFVPYRD